MRISDWSSDVCSSDLGRDLALREDLKQHGRERVAHGAGVARVGRQVLERARLRLRERLGAGSSVARCILVGDEFVLQSLVLCTDAFDLADDLGRVVEAAVRPGAQREMQCMARIVERSEELPDSFVSERIRGAVAERRGRKGGGRGKEEAERGRYGGWGVL